MSDLSVIEKAKFANVANNGAGVIANATAAGALNADTNGTLVHTAGSFGGFVHSLIISTTSAAPVNVFIYIKEGSTIKNLGIVNVPASSGNSGSVNAVDALLGTGVTLQGLQRDVSGKNYIQLEGSEEIKASLLAGPLAGIVTLSTQGNDYSSNPAL